MGWTSAIDGGIEFELAACNQALLNKVGRPGVLVKVDHPCAQMDASGGVERQCEGRIESLLGSDTKKLLFWTSAVDGRPAQKDDRAAQNAVVLVVASRVARSECCHPVIFTNPS